MIDSNLPLNSLCLWSCLVVAVVKITKSGNERTRDIPSLCATMPAYVI